MRAGRTVFRNHSGHVIVNSLRIDDAETERLSKLVVDAALSSAAAYRGLGQHRISAKAISPRPLPPHTPAESCTHCEHLVP